MRERLFAKNDIVSDKYMDTYYMLGKIIFKKKKLLEIDSELGAFVEKYSFGNGYKELVPYDFVQNRINNGFWVIDNNINKIYFKIK